MKTKSAVKERSIRLTGSEVRAILEGRKTQTRRIMKHQPETDIVGATDAGWWYAKGQPGDRLWVRETWCLDADTNFYYKADGDKPWDGVKWSPSIHMPRWASRITLEITDVRVQRLNDISEEDAIAEGCISTVKMIYDGMGPPVDYTGKFAVDEYESLWESINGEGSWAENPYVWVVEFKKVD